MYTFEDINFIMDIPEGFYLSDMNKERDSFFFESKLMPVKYALKFYSEERYKDPKAMIEDVIAQLSAKGGIEEVNWYGRKCYLSTFQFVMPDQRLYAGWAFSIQVPLKNNPDKKQNVLMLTYADAQISRDCDQYMLSIIDSVFFCQEDFMTDVFTKLDGLILSCHLKDIKNKEFYTWQAEECKCGEGSLNIEYYTKLATAHTEDMPMIIEHLHSDEEYRESVKYIQNRLGL